MTPSRRSAARRPVGMVRAGERSCGCGTAGNCIKRSHPTSLAGSAVWRGIGVLVLICALIGVMHLVVPGALRVRHLLAWCESVRVYGDCQSDSSAPGEADPCVLINAVGACENQYQVEHPAHTMVK